MERGGAHRGVPHPSQHRDDAIDLGLIQGKKDHDTTGMNEHLPVRDPAFLLQSVGQSVLQYLGRWGAKLHPGPLPDGGEGDLIAAQVAGTVRMVGPQGFES
jgi:hypothetical protein